MDNSNFTQKTDFRLCESKPCDKTCTEGYREEDVDEHRPPGRRLVGTPIDGKYVVPRGVLPSALKEELRSVKSAIYRFECFEAENNACPDVYIGMATDLHKRMRVYAEMLRRILAIRAGKPVRADKNNLRYVHYRVAQALWNGDRVVLSWYPHGGDELATNSLERQEQLEIAITICDYRKAGGCGYDKVMNVMDSVGRGTQSVDSEWKDVIAVVRNNRLQRRPFRPKSK